MWGGSYRFALYSALPPAIGAWKKTFWIGRRLSDACERTSPITVRYWSSLRLTTPSEKTMVPTAAIAPIMTSGTAMRKRLMPATRRAAISLLSDSLPTPSTVASSTPIGTLKAIKYGIL